MHVAIVGAGALGRVYGVRLAVRAGCEVSFVVRPGRAPSPLRLVRIDGDRSRDELSSPVFETRVPEEADVVIVCVRGEQMNVELDRLLAGRPSVPVVMMTPMLPPDFDRLVRTHGARVRAGMPGVAGYVAADGTCRYWMPRVAPTLIDAATPVPEALGTLVDALRAAGFVARLAPDIGSANPATTISFIPLAMGMDAAGGISALLADRELLRTTLGAIAEAKVLASRVGSRPAWLEWLTRFAGPVSLRIGVSLARRRAPEVLAYVEDHFGRKLHAQNLVMAGTMAAMAHRMQAPADALGRLLVRLEAAPGPTGSPEAAMAAPPSPQK